MMVWHRLEHLRTRAKSLKTLLHVLALAARDPRVPWYFRWASRWPSS